MQEKFNPIIDLRMFILKNPNFEEQSHFSPFPN